MEIARTTYKPIQMVRATVCALCFLFLFLGQAAAQVPAPKYFIKHGRMYIELNRLIKESTLDSFIRKYDLYDLPLKQLLETNIQDSLQKLGWQIEQNKQGYVISKEMMAFEEFDSPADRIVFAEKPFRMDEIYPVGYKPVAYGYNQFKNGAPFASTDSVVTFYLRGQQKAKKVLLAGSFNNWQHGAWPMTLTDSGWIIQAKLPPGKHFYKFIIDGHWIVDPDNQLRENDGRGNTNSVFYKTNKVFTLTGFTDAKRVYLSGSFNNWRPRELAMEKTATGWQLPLYLAEGTHTYKFLVDGEWRADKANPDRLPDGQDGYNSVLRIGKPYIFKLEGHAGASQVVLSGSFNNWREDEVFMTKTTGGWEFPYVLGPGNYIYRFKVDGKWQVNPASPPDSQKEQYDFALVIDPNYTFRLRGYGHAKSVYLTGEFNNWNPSVFAMQREGADWVFPVYLTPGKHLYKFIVDGEWILDPNNKLWEQNEHHTGNSVLWLER